jgi:hypothetical protein
MIIVPWIIPKQLPFKNHLAVYFRKNTTPFQNKHVHLKKLEADYFVSIMIFLQLIFQGSKRLLAKVETTTIVFVKNITSKKKVEI